jgi:hypothetical protein
MFQQPQVPQTSPPLNAMQIAEGGFDAGDSCPVSLKKLEAIAAAASTASSAADESDALNEDELILRDDKIIQDSLGLVDDDGGLVSSDYGSIFQRPMATSQNAEQLLSAVHPVDFRINPYNDDVDVDDDGMLAHIKPMPSLDAGILLCSKSTIVTWQSLISATSNGLKPLMLVLLARLDTRCQSRKEVGDRRNKLSGR